MILQLPLSKTEINSRDLEQVLLGANEIFKTIDCPLIGGHTMIGKDKDPIIGFSILGQKQKKNKDHEKQKENKNKRFANINRKDWIRINFCWY